MTGYSIQRLGYIEDMGKVESIRLTLLVAAISSMVNTQAFASPTSKFLSTSGLFMSPEGGCMMRHSQSEFK